MDSLVIARALHVAALVHWIGGVTFVTLVLLPALASAVAPEERFAAFERLEKRFAFQARISTLIAGASGAWMLHGLRAWDRLLDPRFWWIDLMVAVWAVFTFMLFVAEPLFLHRRVRAAFERDPEATFRLISRLHVVLLTVSLLAVLAGVLGAHGALY